MERNNSEAGEVLACLGLLTSMDNGSLEFGDRLLAKKSDDIVNVTYVGNEDFNVNANISITRLLELQRALRNELLQKKSMRGGQEYHSLHLFASDLQCPERCLTALVGRVDDFVLNGRIINFKAGIQNKAGLLHYSRNFAFEYDLHITDAEAEAIQRKIQSKEISADSAARDLIKSGKLTINPNGFCGPKVNGFGFGEYLASLDERLPYVYQHLKYKLLETGIHYPHLLLEQDEFNVFKKLIKQIGSGLNTTNFYDFNPIDMDLIVMDRKLNTIHYNLATEEGIDYLAHHIYLDVGDASRTGSGNMRKENEIWKFVEGMYFKFEKKDRT